MRRLACKRWLHGLLIGAATWGLSALQANALTSEFPLASAPVADDSSKLVGAWHGEISGYEAYVHVAEDGNDGALRTLVIGGPDNNRTSAWDTLRVLPAVIDGATYLSVELNPDHRSDASDPTQAGFELLRYRTGPEQDYVTLYGPDEDVIDKAIASGEINGDVGTMRLHASPQELADFIEKHHSQDLFSVQIGYLERITDDELPKTLAPRAAK